MALHTELTIHKTAYDLFDAIMDLAKNMPRDFKALIGAELRKECIAILVLIFRTSPQRAGCQARCAGRQEQLRQLRRRHSILIMIPTLAEMLLNKPVLIMQPTSKIHRRDSSEVLRCMEKNAHKPCSKCGNPERHRSKSGRIYTTLCFECYSERQGVIRKNRNSKSGERSS